ncbi:MAG TPA: hypothetical protein EYP55_02460 [Anaerolineae bacterium]|nr:hypothetical protein [Anaerolineae bacterium]
MEMKVGLLWYDDDPKRPFAEKIEAAARRYREKFGVRPNTCYVNPASLPEVANVRRPTVREVEGPETPASVREGNGRLRQIKVVTTPIILPNHFWLGVAEPKG